MQRKGFTLIELVVGLSIAAIVMLGAGQIFALNTSIIKKAMQKAEANGEVQLAMEHIANNVHNSAWVELKDNKNIILHSHSSKVLRSYKFTANVLTYTVNDGLGRIENYVVTRNIGSNKFFEGVGECRNKYYTKVKGRSTNPFNGGFVAGSFKYYRKVKVSFQYKDMVQSSPFLIVRIARCGENWDIKYINENRASLNDGTKQFPATALENLVITSVNSKTIVSKEITCGENTCDFNSSLYLAQGAQVTVNRYHYPFVIKGDLHSVGAKGVRNIIRAKKAEFGLGYNGSKYRNCFFVNSEIFDRGLVLSSAYENMLIRDSVFNCSVVAIGNADNVFVLNNYFGDCIGKSLVIDRACRNGVQNINCCIQNNEFAISGDGVVIDCSLIAKLDSVADISISRNVFTKPAAPLNSGFTDGLYVNTDTNGKGRTNVDIFENKFVDIELPVTIHGGRGSVVYNNIYVRNNSMEKHGTTASYASIFIGDAKPYARPLCCEGGIYVINNDLEGGGIRSYIGYGSECYIMNNVLRNNAHGIYSMGTGERILRNNVISNSAAANLIFIVNTDYSGGYKALNVSIVNNTIINGALIFEKKTLEPVGEIKNNILWANSTVNELAKQYVSYSCVSDLIGLPINKNNISENPLFEDPSNNDYSLSSGSPCKSAGEGGIEMGAYGGEGSAGWEKGVGVQGAVGNVQN